MANMRVTATPAAMLLAVVVVTACLAPPARAHTKFFCTNLIVGSNKRPIRCDGDQSTGSVYTHVVGRGASAWPGVDRTCSGKQKVDQFAEKCLMDRKQRVCSGVPPPMDRIAIVRPGQEVNVAYATNFHWGDVTFFYEGQKAKFRGKQEPHVLDWLNQANYIGKLDQNPRKPGTMNYPADYTTTNGVTCANFKDGDRWSNLAKEYDPALTEHRMCWGPLRIPVDAPAGLNRILMYWWIQDDKGNNIHYFDCAYYWVQGAPVGNFRRATGSVTAATRNSPIYSAMPGRSSKPVTNSSYYKGTGRVAGYIWKQVPIRNSKGMGTFVHPAPWPASIPQ